MGDYTLDEALVAVGFGNYQLILMAFGGIGYVADAMEVMILSFIGSAIQSEWNLSPAEKSLISTVVFFGMLIGAYTFGYVSDTYGRKKGILGVSTITVVTGLLSAFSPNYTSLLIARCMTGVGLGGMHIFTSWFLEFVPGQSRGAWMMTFSSFWIVGVLLEDALAWMIMPSLGWRWLIGLSALPSLVVLLFYGLIPESPRFLCMKGKMDEALLIMVKAASLNGTKLPVGNLVCDHLEDRHEEEDTPSETTAPLLSRKETNGGSSTLSLLLTSKFMRINLLIWFLSFGYSFTYYGVILLTSELIGAQNANLYLDSFITSCAEIPGLVIAAFVVDRIGRKFTMITMFMLSSILLLPILIPQNEILTTSLLAGSRTFVSAISTVTALYVIEIYPTNIRSTSSGISTAFARIGGMICPLVAVGLVNSYPQAYAVMLFVITTFLSGLCVWFLPFETKGKNLQ